MNTNTNNQTRPFSTSIQATLLASLFSLSACGPAAFTVVPTTQSIAAPGIYTIPPKVDILLIEDDKGRMFEAWEEISEQMPNFLKNLSNRGWDYHFTTIALTTYNTIQAVTADSYDGNYGSSWTPPYPGAPQWTPETIGASFFQLPTSYNGYLNPSHVSNALNGMEPGFDTIQAVLKTGLGTSNFLRKDALFVPLIVSLGNDTSGVNFCAAPDSTRNHVRHVPCEQINPPCNGSGGTTCGSAADSLNEHINWFKNFKSNTQVYAAVAGQASNDCLGAKSSIGSRYQQLAAATGGASFDLCSEPISEILSSLTFQLQAQKLDYKQRYLFIDQEADPSTIQVIRYAGGDPAQGTVIPENSENGWSYVGPVTNVHAIDHPIPMNLSSGIAIRLNGSAQISGTDTTSITFKPAGTSDAVAN